jgi:exopolysaccharide production protein ExoZ
LDRTLYNLQALRGVACLMVVGFHLWGWEHQYGVHTPGLGVVQWFGFAGVDLFFALSGFIITHTNARHLGHPAAAPGYLARRLWRIYPPLWAAMLLAGLGWTHLLSYDVLKPGWPADWSRWMLLLPGEPKNPYVAPAWTLTYEVLFYLVFAIVVALPPRLGAGLLIAWAAAILASVPGWRPGGEPFAAVALSPYVLEFLAGCGVAWLVRRGVRGRGRTAVLAGLGYAAAAVVTARALTTGDWMTVSAWEPVRVLVYGPAAALIVYGLAAAELTGTYLAPRWLRPVGDASYSIYLIHCAVGWHAVIYGCYVPHTRLPHLGWLAGTFAACVAAGFALHVAVERPLLKLVKRKKPAPPAGAAPGPADPLRRAA